MELRTRLHTIFMLIGPTECGKTTFANEVLLPQLAFEDAASGFKANVQYLSSDGLRQELLGADYDKYEQLMLEASEPAFQLLYEKLRLVTSFPINAEFAVIDTTGLSEDFRAKVREIAETNHYNLEVVLFDYKRREDYMASERSKKIITNHLNRLRKEVLGSLARERYGKVHKIRVKDFGESEPNQARTTYKIEVEDKELFLSTLLPQHEKPIIIGDVHECVEELQHLLLGYGFALEEGMLIARGKAAGMKAILAGDWIDKGRKTKETVVFLHANREHFRFVLGNHESFVYRYLRGEIKGAEQWLIDTYFDSIAVLQADAELRGKFNELVEQSVPFYRKIASAAGSSFYVTHAPCRNKYVGKLDTHSQRQQRTFRLDREASYEQQLAFLQTEAVNGHPYHLFGHIAAKHAFRIKNKLHLDTGAVHGHALTGVTMSGRPTLRSQKSGSARLREELPSLFREERKVSIHELEPLQLRLLAYSSENKVNFISGTMSPADKDMAAGELESLRKGLDYFKERGVEKVVLQPKYMGSRCTVYLFKEVNECYAVSRNGYRIGKLELTPVYEELLRKHRAYMLEQDIAMLILDGELLPWHALGEGLIERQFSPIEKALDSELAFLERNGFEQALSGLADTYEASGFEKDQHTMSKTALVEKHGLATYQNYKHAHEALERRVALSDHREAYETYKRQLDLYAAEGELVYKPFDLLKIVYADGREELPDWNTSEMFAFLSDDDALAVTLDDENSYAAAEGYYNALTVEQHMEGVVIKPENGHSHAVPYMKVRNSAYLSIIYGYDYRFPHKYAKLLKQKNIASKLRASLSEYRMGKRLLEIPHAEIRPDNQAYVDAAANVLFEAAKEKEIDPRL